MRPLAHGPQLGNPAVGDKNTTDTEQTHQKLRLFQNMEIFLTDTEAPKALKKVQRVFKYSRFCRYFMFLDKATT